MTCCRKTQPARQAALDDAVDEVKLDLEEVVGECVGRVVVNVSVDWEGGRLQDANLERFAAFRKKFSTIPLTHFINPAYFTGSDERVGEMTPKLGALRGRVILPGDEIALHVHCTRSLLRRAGLDLRDDLASFGHETVAREIEVTEADQKKDPVNFAYEAGHYTCLSSFSRQEAAILLRTATKLLSEGLQDLGYAAPQIKGFRAGGWFGGDAAMRALVDEGFTYDSSATDHAAFTDQRRIHHRMMRTMWGAGDAEAAYLRNTVIARPITTESQPQNLGALIEMPDNGVLADYVSADYMEDVIAGAIARAKRRDSPRHVYAHVGFHQETTRYGSWGAEFNYLDRVDQCLSNILARPEQGSIDFVTVGAAAALW